MTIKPAQFPKVRKPNNYWLKVLSDFAEGSDDCVELIPAEGEYKSLRVLQTTVSSAIHRYKFNLGTKLIDGHLFLVKKIRRDA